MRTETVSLDSHQSCQATGILPKPPAILYKYIDSAGGVNLLRNRTLWYRCPLQFADLEECMADLLEGLDIERVRSECLRVVEQLLCGDLEGVAICAPPAVALLMLRAVEGKWDPERVRDQFFGVADDVFKDTAGIRQMILSDLATMRQSIRVLSLCESGDEDYMWASYGECGRGVRIGLRYVPEIDSPHAAARRINYYDSWPLIATPTEWAKHIVGIEKIQFDHPKNNPVFLKRAKYQREKEWRLITRPNSDSPFDAGGIHRVELDPREVCEITLGKDCILDHERQIRDIAAMLYPHIKVAKI